MFYLKTIEQLLLFIDQLDQLEVCLPNIRHLTGIPKLAVFQNLRWNSNKTSLHLKLSELSFIQVESGCVDLRHVLALLWQTIIINIENHNNNWDLNTQSHDSKSIRGNTTDLLSKIVSSAQSSYLLLLPCWLFSHSNITIRNYVKSISRSPLTDDIVS